MDQLTKSARDRKGDEAYERELEPARLPLSHPQRVPYPEAAKRALAAWDDVMEAHR